MVEPRDPILLLARRYLQHLLLSGGRKLHLRDTRTDVARLRCPSRCPWRAYAHRTAQFRARRGPYEEPFRILPVRPRGLYVAERPSPARLLFPADDAAPTLLHGAVHHLPRLLHRRDWQPRHPPGVYQLLRAKLPQDVWGEHRIGYGLPPLAKG